MTGKCYDILLENFDCMDNGLVIINIYTTKGCRIAFLRSPLSTNRNALVRNRALEVMAEYGDTVLPNCVGSSEAMGGQELTGVPK